MNIVYIENKKYYMYEKSINQLSDISISFYYLSLHFYMNHKIINICLIKERNVTFLKI